jgi:hypothetical protein
LNRLIACTIVLPSCGGFGDRTARLKDSSTSEQL